MVMKKSQLVFLYDVYLAVRPSVSSRIGTGLKSDAERVCDPKGGTRLCNRRAREIANQQTRK